MRTRVGLTLLLVVVFLVNLGETAAEEHLGAGAGTVSKTGYAFANAMEALESKLSLGRFENHDATDRISIYGYSFSYFFLFPVLCLAVLGALLMREDISGYRVLCLSVAIDYTVSLFFFIFMPVPERWAYPDSGALLLSDLWTSKLIGWIRPISAMDNCFPSTHTSLTVILILVCYYYQVRFRITVLGLGIIVILATYVLGIHWVPDILAGIAVAWLSVEASRGLDLALSAGTTRRPRSLKPAVPVGH
jgi:membrane-associated phospholipid phosphatase